MLACELLSECIRIETELLDDGHAIGHHPLAINLVLVDHAVSDRPRHEGSPGRFAIMAALAVPPRTGDEMRGVEPLFVIATPNDLGGHAPALGQRNDALDSVAHHFF